MNGAPRVRPTIPKGRAETPACGDTWQSNALDRLIPLLERHGYRVVDGSVGIAGLDVRRGGETFTITLLAPTTLDLRVIRDGDDVSSDRHPEWPCYSPTDDVAVDPND